MNRNQSVNRSAMKVRESARSAFLTRTIAVALAVASVVCVQQEAVAGDREQAKRMYDRLTGTPPSPALLDTLTARVASDGLTGTAMYIMDNTQPHSSPFYSVTLKNFATPWTNRDQTVFAPLNDYTATVIGMVRDNKDFRGLLSDDILYIGNATPGYSNTDNAHYEALEASNADLRVGAAGAAPVGAERPAFDGHGRDHHLTRGGAGLLHRWHQSRHVPLHADESPVSRHGADA